MRNNARENKFLAVSILAGRRHSDRTLIARPYPGIFINPLRLFGKNNPGRKLTK
jgi:hypothetical protein